MSSTWGVMRATSILFMIRTIAAPGLSASAASWSLLSGLPRVSGACDSRDMHSVYSSLMCPRWNMRILRRMVVLMDCVAVEDFGLSMSMSKRRTRVHAAVGSRSCN
eukprot:scaffold37943_cov37-Attheya_sp.AAC.1